MYVVLELVFVKLIRPKTQNFSILGFIIFTRTLPEYSVGSE